MSKTLTFRSLHLHILLRVFGRIVWNEESRNLRHPSEIEKIYVETDIFMGYFTIAQFGQKL